MHYAIMQKRHRRIILKNVKFLCDIMSVFKIIYMYIVYTNDIIDINENHDTNDINQVNGIKDIKCCE